MTSEKIKAAYILKKSPEPTEEQIGDLQHKIASLIGVYDVGSQEELQYHLIFDKELTPEQQELLQQTFPGGKYRLPKR